MGEIWVAGAVSVVGGIMSGKAAEKKDKADKAYSAKESRAIAKDEAKYNAIQSLFETELSDYQSQLQRQRKERGLDQFRGFSTVNKFAPGYTDTSRIVMPEKPTIDSVNTLIDQANLSEATSTAGKKRSTVSKILDPVGLFS